MSLALKDTESNVVGNLGTWVYTVPTAGYYTFSCISTVIPQSSLSVVINQNASPIASNATPSATQNHIEVVKTGVTCALNDSITFVLSSAAAIDAAPNSVTSIITIAPVVL